MFYTQSYTESVHVPTDLHNLQKDTKKTISTFHLTPKKVAT